ncbi:hypothetical protein COT87_02220 [Candidatus Collierbacteria bacterium CG10_big_fil_rev_8_21_14_0_10_44_9]|uniref:Major facilitator superfamily (MFS) profile domain-containing protein n=1 Tax=Candidatus Collierbacteria bacterium CG10_big_fil_rev_8_21_14_0_10_44_9 TaxID=1974535 RepID=A0A2H0VIL5_9BACT|nr:MAG: hypothetical protein COT87_02220 [Candidatus Collierbacteria bacterium CG10_big_fil_rev_8_21_14_0_10_44_9]
MKNIRLAYILTFLSECYWPSVATLFFYLQYFSFAQIATLWAIQMAATNLLEIPTGALADVVGRKIAIVLSFTTGAVILLIFPFTTAFGVFAILEIMKGLSNALYSGSMEALVYDDLKVQKKEGSYPTVASQIETVTWASWAISSVGGGYLYYLNFRSPWLIQAGMFAVGAGLALRLVEPKLDTIKVSVAKAVRQNWHGCTGDGMAIWGGVRVLGLGGKSLSKVKSLAGRKEASGGDVWRVAHQFPGGQVRGAGSGNCAHYCADCEFVHIS